MKSRVESFRHRLRPGRRVLPHAPAARALSRSAAVAAVAAATAACGVFSPDVWEQRREVLEQNRARWGDAAVPSYRYTVLKQCSCRADSYGLAQVTVTDGEVSSVAPVYRIEPVPEEDLVGFDTVEDMFLLIEVAIEVQARYFEIEYDPALGHPTRIDLDFTRGGLSKMFIEVTDFEVIEPE